MTRSMVALFTLVVAAMAITAAHAQRTCKTIPHTEAQRKAEQAEVLEYHKRERRAATPLRIPVIFHIMHKANGEGKATRASIDAQIDVMTKSFQGTTAEGGIGYNADISFVLDRVNYIQNDAYFTKCEANDDVFKKAHTIDPTRYLNIFTCGGSGYLGWSPLADDYAESSKMNAVVLVHSSLPAQPLGAPYNLGDTAVHEVGHFFGLEHTFSESGLCNEATGDGVDDTPMEKSAAEGCPVTRDSCPSSPGLDPVWNFMDYSDDQCMSRFSKGQVERMRAMIALHKPLLVQNSAVSGTIAPTTTKPTTTKPATTTTKPTTTKPASTSKPTSTSKATATAPRLSSSSPATTAKPTTTSKPTTTKPVTTSKPTTTKPTTTTTTTTTKSIQTPSSSSTPIESSTTTEYTVFSALTCQELNWPVSSLGYVCGATRISGSCLGLVSLASASQVCDSLGARLCSLDEISLGFASPVKSLQCPYQTTGRFWTSTPCDGGSYTVGHKGVPKLSCISSASTTKAYVHCCADQY